MQSVKTSIGRLSLETLPEKEKLEKIKWVLDKLASHDLHRSKIIHFKQNCKSNYESYRKEGIVLKDMYRKCDQANVDLFMKEFEEFRGQFDPQNF